MNNCGLIVRIFRNNHCILKIWTLWTTN